MFVMMWIYWISYFSYFFFRSSRHVFFGVGVYNTIQPQASSCYLLFGIWIFLFHLLAKKIIIGLNYYSLAFRIIIWSFLVLCWLIIIWLFLAVCKTKKIFFFFFLSSCCCCCCSFFCNLCIFFRVTNLISSSFIYSFIQSIDMMDIWMWYGSIIFSTESEFFFFIFCCSENQSNA